MAKASRGSKGVVAPRRSRLMAVVVGLSFAATAATAEIVEFRAILDGVQAAACAGTGSSATGLGFFTLDTVTGDLDYNITFQGLSSAETISHIHGPAAKCVGAPPVVDLPLGNPKVGSDTLTTGEVADMLAELHYVNIHSTINPSGEIRGQIRLKRIVPTTSQWSIVVAGLSVVTLASVALIRRQRSTVTA